MKNSKMLPDPEKGKVFLYLIQEDPTRRHDIMWSNNAGLVPELRALKNARGDSPKLHSVILTEVVIAEPMIPLTAVELYLSTHS